MPLSAVKAQLTAIYLLMPAGQFLLAQDKAAQTAPDFTKIQPLLESYCYKCHDADSMKGDLQLDGFKSTAEVLHERKTWLKVLEQLESREMPTKKPLPTDDEYADMIAWVDSAVNKLDWEKIKTPGHVTIPRLTKTEYNRTIRDLLGLDSKPGDVFSEDGEGKSGFNNDRDALFISASQMEKYFEAAEKALNAVMALNLPAIETQFEAEKMFMTETGSQTSPIDDAGALGYILNRGQMTLYDSIEIPADGFYKISVRARSTTNGPTGGVLRINDVLKGEVIISGREPEIKTLNVFLPEGSHQMAWNIQNQVVPAQKKTKEKKERPATYAELPADAGAIVGRESKIQAPVFPVTGEETPELKKLIDRWNANQTNVQRPFEWLRLHGEKGNPSELKRFHSYVVDRSKTPNEIRKDIATQLGITEADFDQKVLAANPEKMAGRERMMKYSDVPVTREKATPGQFAVDWIKIEGPVPVGNIELAKSVAALFTIEQGLIDDQTGSDRKGVAIKQGLIDEATGLIRRAFRRPLTEDEIAKFQGVYDRSLKGGADHAESMKQMLIAALVSPKFLYRTEPGEGKEYALDEWQLASRLSYFLWQTMPDEALFAEAESGTLKKNLAAQVDRMLTDEKAQIFYESFGGQWLGYSGLGETITPDPKAFTNFSAELAEAMKIEANWLFETIFQENRPITDLITARETFLNAQLAQHYGIPGVKGTNFQTVALETDQRGGILGMGSVLTATSTPVRTSPVIRGVFIMEKLLGDEPGEPPANAGTLPGNAGPNRGKTLREELEIHRDRADCAGCHDKIDPLGFGLENFDAVGQFRTKEGRKEIDATGILPDGTTFKGIGDLRDYLLNERRDDFLRNVTERLLKFALGRELQTPDEAAIRGILKRGEETHFQGADMVKSIVESYPFLNQSAENGAE